MKTWVIASNTFRQIVRQQAFYNIIVFGIGLVMLALVVGNITFGYPDRIVRSIGLSGLGIALDLMALLLGVGLVYGELDRRTLFVILTRPVNRGTYVAGRYLGLVLALSMALVGLFLAFTLALTSVDGSLRSQDFLAAGASLLEASLIGGIGLVLSCFSTPTLSAGMGLGIWVAAASSDSLVQLAKVSNQEMAPVAEAMAAVLPALSKLNLRSAAVYAQPVAAEELLLMVAYTLGYALFLWGASTLILSRREMV